LSRNAKPPALSRWSFTQGLIKSSDIIGSSNKAQADFFLWRNKKFKLEQYEEWIERPKPCIKGSDSHSAAETIGALKDANSQPIQKHCWIKADPTFKGLYQITIEPEGRVFIGNEPPHLSRIRSSPTKYISGITIKRVSDAGPDNLWFDCATPLNGEMTAIIGNKGGGKSALSDIIALSANSHCDARHFSFLNTRKFCVKNGKIAKCFEARCEWLSGRPSSVTLDLKAKVHEPERVRYIPQAFLEALCTETDPGEQSEFQQELRRVIFSHIDESDRSGMGDLQELLAHRTEELAVRLGALRSQVRSTNAQLAKLRALSTPEKRRKIESQKALKQTELDAHSATRPTVVEKPDGDDPAKRVQHAEMNRKIEDAQEKINELDEKISDTEKSRTELKAQVRATEKVIQRIQNIKASFDSAMAGIASEIDNIGIDRSEVASLTIGTEKLTILQEVFKKSNTDIEEQLDPEIKGSLTQKRACLNKTLHELKEQLDAPNRAYQKFVDELKDWSEKAGKIFGDKEKEGTIAYYDELLRYISEDLQDEISQTEIKRHKIATEIFSTIKLTQSIYDNLFAPVQKLVADNTIIRSQLGLSFRTAIADIGFSSSFLGKFINQGAAGSFYGKEQGEGTIGRIIAEHDFNEKEQALKFIECIESHLMKDMRRKSGEGVSADSQLRKGISIEDLQNFLWSFEYLKPTYSLSLDGDISLLSPGERGTRLLVFYLLVDNSDIPIVIDQPEENLDSHTVYKLLIPAIKEVKKRRQIIMVTHSPNIAVVCDAEQIIHARIDRKHGNKVTYSSGSIESSGINRSLVDVLEGTTPAFRNRESKYQF